MDGFLSDTINRPGTPGRQREPDSQKGALPHPTGKHTGLSGDILPATTYFFELLGKLLVSLVSDKPDGSSELMITFWGWNATSGVDQHSSQTDQSLGGTDYYHLLLLLLNHLELGCFFVFLRNKKDSMKHSCFIGTEVMWVTVTNSLHISLVAVSNEAGMR